MIGTYVELRDQALRVENALRQVLERQEVWHCNRVWEAWAVDAMSRDDFSLVTEDPVAIEELVQAVMSVSQPATVSNAATEALVRKQQRYIEELERVDGVGLSERAYKAEAERDAAIAAIERVRAVAEDGVWRDTKTSGDWAWALDHMAHKILAALDGAPEPELEREYRRVRPDGVPVFNAVFETMPLLDDYYTAEYRTVSPWLPVEGESDGV